MAKRNDFTNDEFGAKLCRAYDSVAELHENGDRDDDAVHPREILNSWQREAREAREAAATGGTDEDETTQPSKTAGGNSGNGGTMPAQDGRYTIGIDNQPRFERADGVVYVGDQAVAMQADAVDPRKVRAMAGAIKGYRRI